LVDEEELKDTIRELDGNFHALKAEEHSLIKVLIDKELLSKAKPMPKIVQAKSKETFSRSTRFKPNEINANSEEEDEEDYYEETKQNQRGN